MIWAKLIQSWRDHRDFGVELVGRKTGRNIMKKSWYVWTLEVAMRIMPKNMWASCIIMTFQPKDEFWDSTAVQSSGAFSHEFAQLLFLLWQRQADESRGRRTESLAGAVLLFQFLWFWHGLKTSKQNSMFFPFFSCFVWWAQLSPWVCCGSSLEIAVFQEQALLAETASVRMLRDPHAFDAEVREAGLGIFLFCFSHYKNIKNIIRFSKCLNLNRCCELHKWSWCFSWWTFQHSSPCRSDLGGDQKSPGRDEHVEASYGRTSGGAVERSRPCAKLEAQIAVGNGAGDGYGSSPIGVLCCFFSGVDHKKAPERTI